MMNWNKAINAGVLGALAMSAFMVILRAVGMTSMNLEMTLGSQVTASFGFPSWVLGLLIHVIAGGVFGIVYGGIMEWLGRSGWEVGLAISTVHALLSGLAMPLVGAIHPLVRNGQMEPPGAFASSLGAGGVILFLLQHWIYGVLVGASYVVLNAPKPVRPPIFTGRRPPTTVHRAP